MYHRTKHRPQQHQEPYCLRLRLLLYHLGRPIKGYWDMKTTQYIITWLIARSETGLISQSMWTRPSYTIEHPWACTSSKIAKQGHRETLFYKNLLRLTRRRYLVRNLLRPQGHREELVKALPRELVKAPLREPFRYPGDSEEGLNRRSARDLDNDSNATATRRRCDGDATAAGRLNEVETRAKL